MDRKQILVLAVIIIVTLIGVNIAIAAYTALTIPASTTVETNGAILAFHSDGVTSLTSIPFGSNQPGTSPTYVIVVKNTGNVAETLSKSTTSTFTLSWNYTGTVAVGASVPILLTLTIPADATPGLRDFNIVITPS